MNTRTLIPIVLAVGWPLPSMIGVLYPRRKSQDIIMNMAGAPMHCLACRTDISAETLLSHVRSHAPSKSERPVCTPDGHIITRIFLDEQGAMLYNEELGL